MQEQQQTAMVCIATGQTLPNLIPILIKKPDVVIILATTDMEKKAHQLEKCIKQDVASCRVEIRTGAPDSLLSAIWDYGKQTADYLKKCYPNDTITLNATGGTKLMFIGFVTSMREVFNEMIYVDTDNGRIEFIPKDNEQKSPEQIPSVLTTRHYLEAQGYQIKSILSDDKSILADIEKRREITFGLASNAFDFDSCGLLSELNGKLDKVKGYNKDKNNLIKKVDTPLNFKKPDDKELEYYKAALNKWNILFKRGNQLGTFTWNSENNQLGWRYTRALEYLSGVWLEEYVYLVAKDLQNLTDLTYSVKTYQKADNEFDILITHNNKILVIECKTVDLKSKYHKEKGNEIAYKLDSLSEQIKGIYGDTWLVTSSTPTKDFENRAEQLGITIINATELPKLGELIAKWANLPPPVKMQTTENNAEFPQGSLQAALKNVQISH